MTDATRNRTDRSGDRTIDRLVAGLVALALPFLAASGYFSMATLQAGRAGVAAWAAVVVQAGLIFWMARFALRIWRSAGVDDPASGDRS